MVIREAPEGTLSSPYALTNGTFNPQAFSSRVGRCSTEPPQRSPLLRLDQSDTWPWLTAEAAVRQAEAAGGADFRRTEGGKLNGLTLQTDTDGRVKWLVGYDVSSSVFMNVMLDAQSGAVLCAERSIFTFPTTHQCHWGVNPRQ